MAILASGGVARTFNIEDTAACVPFAKAGLSSQSVWVLGERGLSHKEHVMVLEKTDRQIENDRVRVTRHRKVRASPTG